MVMRIAAVKFPDAIVAVGDPREHAARTEEHR